MIKRLWSRLRTADRVAVVGIGLAAALLLLRNGLVGIWIHKNEPIYPAYMKHPASIAELRSDLEACEQTKRIVIPELSKLLPGEQSFQTMMDGKTRAAKPNGYCIKWDDAELDGIQLLEIEGYVRPEGYQLFGGSYREHRIKLENQSDGFGKLWIIRGDFYYTVSASFDASELSEAEIEEHNAALETFLYSVADQIIDAAAP